MPITDLPILSMLRTRLQWSQQRQAVLAANVANADTPSYRPRDLAPLTFTTPAQVTAPPLTSVSLVRTESGHLGGAGQGDAAFQSKTESSYEVRPTGNSVNLEQEMMKVAANQMDYQAVTALYTRSLSMLKTALGKGSS
jgi:flagellar basal-body rod protein FlgB